jgi:hypothetical protein
MTRRKYTHEYKREAVVLTRVPGATIQAVALLEPVPAGDICAIWTNNVGAT